MTQTIGIDGCKAGWVAAIGTPAQFSIVIAKRYGDLFDQIGMDAIYAIDMPMGLPDRVGPGGRAPERLVRPLLGQRQSSLFSIPARAAIEAQDYPAACRLALETSDPPRKVSKQGFNLFPKIRELDQFRRSDRGRGARLFEVHPELAFVQLNDGQPLDLPKKVKGAVFPPGMALRRQLLAKGGFALDRVRMLAGAQEDDVLDALAALSVAMRLEQRTARPFPDPPQVDAHGIPIAIWG
jgi:predicted RNase H-like nuclease